VPTALGGPALRSRGHDDRSPLTADASGNAGTCLESSSRGLQVSDGAIWTRSDDEQAARMSKPPSSLVAEATDNEIAPLRILIANERRLRLELLAEVVSGLGHEVVAVEVDVRDVGAATAREAP